jgi:hypothetical protein
MVDGINIIYPKIKSFDEKDSNEDSFLNSELYEAEIFNDVRSADGICAQCGQNHGSKQHFKDIKTSIDCISDLSPLNKKTIEISTNNRRYGTSHTQALICRHCCAPIIVEVTTKIYNLEPYVKDEKVEHGHPENPDTICDALERVATEARLG